MSAAATAGTEGISARYAAQIRELLYVQAIKRMAAEQEAARDEGRARQAAILQVLRARRTQFMDEPVNVHPETAKAAEAAEPLKHSEPKAEARPSISTTVAPAQLFDEKV